MNEGVPHISKRLAIFSDFLFFICNVQGLSNRPGFNRRFYMHEMVKFISMCASRKSSTHCKCVAK
jgi:hypothetical protein